MNGDALNGTLDTLGTHDDCLAALPRLTVLAHTLGGLKAAWGLDVMLPDRQLAAKLSAVSKSLGDSSTMPIPTPFPVGPEALSALGQLALVAASFAMLRRRFGVKLQDPIAVQRLRTNIPGLNGKVAFKMPGLRSRLFGLLTPSGRMAISPRLPQLSQANLGRLGVLAAASTALRRNLGINVLEPNAGLRIRYFSERLQTHGFFEVLRLPRSASSASSNMAALVAFAGALHSVKRGLGVDLLWPKPGTNQLLAALLEPDSPLALLCIDVATASTDPGIKPGLHLGHDLEARVGLVSALGLAQSSLGLDLRGPDAPLRAHAMLRSLENSGVCGAAQSVPIGPKEIDGLGRLRTQTSAMAASRSAFGANMLAPGANAKLDAAIKSFASNGGSDLVRSVRVPPEMVVGLGKLTMLAAA